MLRFAMNGMEELNIMYVRSMMLYNMISFGRALYPIFATASRCTSAKSRRALRVLVELAVYPMGSKNMCNSKALPFAHIFRRMSLVELHLLSKHVRTTVSGLLDTCV